MKERIENEINSCVDALENLAPETDDYTKAAKNLQTLTDEYVKIRQVENERYQIEQTSVIEDMKMQIETQSEDLKNETEKKNRIATIMGDVAKVLALIGGEFLLTHYIYKQEDIEGNIGDQKKLKKLDLLKRVKL